MDSDGAGEGVGRKEAVGASQTSFLGQQSPGPNTVDDTPVSRKLILLTILFSRQPNKRIHVLFRGRFCSVNFMNKHGDTEASLVL